MSGSTSSAQRHGQVRIGITQTDVLDAKRTAAHCVGLLLGILLATSTEGQLSNDDQVTETTHDVTLSIKYSAVASWRSRICDMG